MTIQKKKSGCRTINHEATNGLSEQAIITKAAELAQCFASRAAKHDREGSFPFENFKELRNAGFLTLTVPAQFGGVGIGLSTFIRVIQELAKGDASTALGLGWHLGIIMNATYTKAWHEKAYKEICQKVVEKGYLLNACATEPDTGSPSRGAKPETIASKAGDEWVITGRKTWSTLSPALDYFIISAYLDGEEAVGNFLIKKGTPGLRIEETWDSLGMRATGSHDVVLEKVHAPLKALIERRPLGQPSKKTHDGNGWLLHIAACYLGLAQAARDFALRFAVDYVPPSVGKPISELPKVQERLGEMERDLYTAEALIYYTAAKWEKETEDKRRVQPEIGVAKFQATNLAVRIVDQAMRIVGGRSMLKAFPLERYYRDVRAGLHNPPMDDVVIKWLSDRAIGQVK
jgi:alkylation response protein AidB-like acyl-CoA dehydrogenase